MTFLVSANKGIFAGPEGKYKELLAASKSGHSRLLHETTVGAGLPVLGTLAGLKASSHDIVTVEGVLSGTLAFVLGEVAGGKATLSQAVKQAKELGYTEPDPRKFSLTWQKMRLSRQKTEPIISHSFHHTTIRR